MTKTDFVRKLSNDLRVEHEKRLKMWQEGHTDKEIAFACNTTTKTISKWRKTHNLTERVCITVTRRKDPSWLRKGTANKFSAIKDCL